MDHPQVRLLATQKDGLAKPCYSICCRKLFGSLLLTEVNWYFPALNAILVWLISQPVSGTTLSMHANLDHDALRELLANGYKCRYCMYRYCLGFWQSGLSSDAWKNQKIRDHCETGWCVSVSVYVLWACERITYLWQRISQGLKLSLQPPEWGLYTGAPQEISRKISRWERQLHVLISSLRN